VTKLYENVNNVVLAHLKQALEAGGTVNVSDWVSDVTEALADLVLHGAPTDERPALIGHAHQQLDQHITEKRAVGVGGDKR
jgi:hypothetical protein